MSRPDIRKYLGYQIEPYLGYQLSGPKNSDSVEVTAPTATTRIRDIGEILSAKELEEH